MQLALVSTHRWDVGVHATMHTHGLQPQHCLCRSRGKSGMGWIKAVSVKAESNLLLYVNSHSKRIANMAETLEQHTLSSSLQ